MTSLLLTICLAANPSECRTEPIAFDGSPVACALFGQQAAIEWLAMHPKWQLSKWRCGPATRET